MTGAAVLFDLERAEQSRTAVARQSGRGPARSGHFAHFALCVLVAAASDVEARAAASALSAMPALQSGTLGLSHPAQAIAAQSTASHIFRILMVIAPRDVESKS